MSYGFEIQPDGLVWRGSGETVLVQAWGSDAVRVRSTIGDVVDTDWALLPPRETRAEVIIEGDVATVTVGRLQVIATKRAGRDHGSGQHRARCSLEFLDADGRSLLHEQRGPGPLRIEPRRYSALPGGGYAIQLNLQSDPDEKLAGMGLYQEGVGNLKGNTFQMEHRNSQVSVPFVMSNAGYGLLWHCPAVGRATFGRNRTEFTAEAADQIDYWVTTGETPAEVSRALADATGHTPVMPEFGLGFWQSKLRYASQEDLMSVAREYKARGLSVDVIVADFFHWPKMGDFRFEEEFWPDPAAMTRELEEMGIKLMVSVWPQVSLESENFNELDHRGYLVRSNAGIDTQMWFQGPSRFFDVTHPGAREWLWQKCRQNYPGARLFWLDEAEPEWGIPDAAQYRYHLGQVSAVGNIYPQLYSRLFHDGQRNDGIDDVVNLVRCAWLGSQRYGALVWSGDIASTWESLRAQIAAGLHMGVAGIPWFTTDIGGFYGGDPDDPVFRELFVRWFQFGTFLPVMRLHGDRQPARPVTTADGTARLSSGADNEVWSYGPEAYEICVEHMHQRERMRPYLRRVMDEARLDGQPIMRGLFHEFPADPVTWEVFDQFLLGGDLMVAPVLEAGGRSRRMYLPEGANWTDVATGERQEGGQWVKADAPLERIPVFARDGAFDEIAM